MQVESVSVSNLFDRWSAPNLTKPTFEEAMQQKFKTAKKVCSEYLFQVTVAQLVW